MAQVRTRWRDPATWREVAYLIGLWPLLFALDTVVLTVWLTLLAGVTLPAWYWAPRGNVAELHRRGPAHGVPLGYFPHGPHGPGSWGLYVDTLPKASLAAACFLVAFLLFNYVLVLTARAHARIARALLRAPPTRWRGQGGAHPPGPAGPTARSPLRPGRAALRPARSAAARPAECRAPAREGSARGRGHTTASRTALERRP